MAVYTEVSFDEASDLLETLKLGTLENIEPCKGGIENTNYFVTTDQAQLVLTLFERLTFEQLPFYLRLMKHLAKRGIPVPDPAANDSGQILHSLKDKPAAVVNRLRGKSQLAPQAEHCEAVGHMLARMHLAGQDFDLCQPNLRGLNWWNETVPVVMPFLDSAQRCLIQSELAYQNHIAAGSAYTALPRGPIHGDLFRDNVMFEDQDGQVVLSGFFDFYFAGIDTFLFDIAVCLNDWCIDLQTGEADIRLAKHFLKSYGNTRPLSCAERQLLPAMLRAAALRFWISRLWDFHLPREASLLKAHDPRHFEQVLSQRVIHAERSAAHLDPS